MKRRSFIKTLAPLGMTPFLFQGMSVRAMTSARMAQAFSCEEVQDRVLVIIQLHGGNDGANTLVPIDQYAAYKNLRPFLAIPDSGARAYIPLDNTLPIDAQVGLHPEMAAFKDMYDDGLVNIIQSVSYDNINKSHFKGSNLWLSGGDSSSSGQNISSGWFGRYLDHLYPNFPNAYPNPFMEDPLGLEFGSKTISLGFHRESGMPIGLAMSNDPTDFHSMVSAIGGVSPDNFPITRHGNELQYLVDVQMKNDQYSERLNAIYNAGNNLATYPETYHTQSYYLYENELAPQLRTVARLISGGSKTKIYLVRLTGFDTHAGQVQGGDSTLGGHAALLYHFSEAMKAFQEDLRLLGLENRVMAVTFSEFGRQAGENASSGTDHGTLAPMFLFGRGANPGMTGVNPSYTNIVGNDFTDHQYDYRQVYTTLLQDWLGLGAQGLGVIGFDNFESQKLDLINSNYDDGSGNALDFVCDGSCYAESASFPVGLIYFNAQVEDGVTVRLNWSTATEMNNSHFEIERSHDAALFERIIQVPGAGNSIEQVDYTTVDENPLPNISYYRLKQVDVSGAHTYHGVVEVKIEGENASPVVRMYVSPNPASERVGISLNVSEDMPAQIQLYATASAKRVFTQDIELFRGANHREVNVSQLSTGMYVLEIIANPALPFAAKRLGKTRLMVQR